MSGTARRAQSWSWVERADVLDALRGCAVPDPAGERRVFPQLRLLAVLYRRGAYPEPERLPRSLATAFSAGKFLNTLAFFGFGFALQAARAEAWGRVPGACSRGGSRPGPGANALLVGGLSVCMVAR